jgi:lysozyme
VSVAASCAVGVSYNLTSPDESGLSVDRNFEDYYPIVENYEPIGETPLKNAIIIASELAKPFEGLSLAPYHDPVGFPTQYYGRLLSREPWADLSKWKTGTQEDADACLRQDMASAAASVNRLITFDINDNQKAALIDFTYNAGAGNLQASTLRRVINRGDLDEAPKQLMRWVYARKQKLRGLVRRRKAEADLWVA